MYAIFPLLLPFSFIIAPQRVSVGMGHSHSKMNRSLQTTGASHILTHLESRSITGHTLPIQVHQHYGFEFHLVLTTHSCIRRGCHTEGNVRRICTQLERSSLEGLCSCVFDKDCMLSLSAKVEQCFRARPLLGLGRTLCNCEECTSNCRLEINELVRWLRKNRQWALHRQREVCCCRSDSVEMMD